jgi:hypothetical protein
MSEQSESAGFELNRAIINIAAVAIVAGLIALTVAICLTAD